MKLDLRQFAEFPAVATVTIEAGEIAPVAEEVRQIGPLSLDLTIQKGAEEYYCHGTLAGTVALECSRCLSAYDESVRESVTFIACGEQVVQQLREEAADDEEYVVFSGSDAQVDLNEPIRQALLVALPMMPLCSDECKGLCPGCGANRNSTRCACQSDVVDPRWAALTDMKKRMDKKEMQE